MPKSTRQSPDQTLPLRVYQDSFDKTGTVMCPRHYKHFLSRNPAAFGCGEYGGTCKYC